MNNRTDKQDYKSIKAPVELKSRVLGSVGSAKKENIVSYTKTWSLIAACLVLVACVGLFQFLSNPIVVSVEPITVATASRDSEAFVAIIKIEHEGGFTVNADNGGFAHVDEDGNVFKTSLQGYETNDLIFLGWRGIEDKTVFSVNDVEYKISCSQDGTVTVKKNK